MLETDRLRLRQPELADFDFVSALWRDQKVRRYLGGPVAEGQLAARWDAYLRAPTQVGVWLVAKREDARSVGLVVVNPHQDGAGYEVSYEFACDVWGYGLAGEAVAAVLDHLLAEGGLSQVLAETQSANLASCRLLERLGIEEARRLVRYGAEQRLFVRRA
ncbi:MAG: GNAT family N-acetyltransferase [Shimia sp.]|nr:GNAT family N-acetyltransferase [Shimia sp.]